MTRTVMNRERKEHLQSVYRAGLLNDILPFWIENGVDTTHGGFLTALNRDGTIIDTDKGMWQQGRFTWLLGTLYNTVEPRESWLHLARHGIDFIKQHGFDKDGRMFFLVTREGRPLRKRRYVFSEAFASIAYAAYAKAANDDEAATRASELFNTYKQYASTPGLIPAKTDADTRPSQGIGMSMIAINIAQVLRDTIDDPTSNRTIDEAIDTIQRYFMKPDLKVVMEMVGPSGEIIDHFDGRTLNPGHAIEAAWFILHEAKCRNNDAHLIDIGCKILDWMWERGWDKEYGGILYFRDVYDLPVQDYWHDMKFWWPHNETIIATLLAYHLTGNEKYAQWHEMVHDWSYKHFPDPEHGEWYGYLHRDGRISVQMKGNTWKGPFHLPRMQLYCWQLLNEMLGTED